MRDLPLVALRALAAVYSHGGVRAAARELGIAHSSVSRHLAGLETWLHVTIVEQSTGPRDFALTPQGNALGEAALAAMRQLTLAGAATREAKSARSVTISTTPSVADRWLLPRLSDFERKHRGIELSVVVDQKLDDFQRGDVDVAIRMGRGPWKDLYCEPLMDDALYPVMSPSFFEKAGRPQSSKQLLGLRLLHDRDPCASWAIWRDAHGPRDLDVRAGPRFASSDLVLRAAALSQGVALARHRLAEDGIASGAIVRPFGERAVAVPDAYWIVMTNRSRAREPVKSLVAWLKNSGSGAGALSV